MRSTRRDRPGDGFTILELLAVLALLTIGLLIVGPPLQGFIAQSKTRGVVQETAALMRLARLEAIKRSVAGVVQVDLPGSQAVAPPDEDSALVRAFVDQDRDGLFEPGAGDREIGRTVLPEGVTIEPVDGLTPDPRDADLPAMAVFLNNGSAIDAGAFRFKDVRDNQVEVRLEPAASGQVTVRKLQGADWVEQGATTWTWN